MSNKPTPKSPKKSRSEISVAESVDILSRSIAGFDFHVDADDFILYELNRMIDEGRASFEDEEFRILIDEGVREHVEENLVVRAKLAGQLRIAAKAADPATRTVAERVIRLLDRLGLPARLKDQPVGEALRFLALDKKRRGASVRVVLLRDVGDPRVVELPLPRLVEVLGGIEE